MPCDRGHLRHPAGTPKAFDLFSQHGAVRGEGPKSEYRRKLEERYGIAREKAQRQVAGFERRHVRF